MANVNEVLSDVPPPLVPDDIEAPGAYAENSQADQRALQARITSLEQTIHRVRISPISAKVEGKYSLVEIG